MLLEMSDCCDEASLVVTCQAKLTQMSLSGQKFEGSAFLKEEISSKIDILIVSRLGCSCTAM